MKKTLLLLASLLVLNTHADLHERENTQCREDSNNIQCQEQANNSTAITSENVSAKKSWYEINVGKIIADALSSVLGD